jgi:hypothetical protein
MSAMNLRRRLGIWGGAAVIQMALLLAALWIGVRPVPPPREIHYPQKVPSPTLQREARRAQEETLARLNRAQGPPAQAQVEQLLQSLQPLPDLPPIQPVEALKGMKALVPLPTAFRQSAESAFAGLQEDAFEAPEPVTFLGETLAARRILLLIDVSASVKSKMEQAGLPLSALRDEVLRLIEDLSPDHLFGIVQFSRKWLPFETQLLPATTVVKARASEWMHSKFRTTGTSGRNWQSGQPNGIEGVLRTAFAASPQIDEVILLSDGDFQTTPPGGGGRDVSPAELDALTRELLNAAPGTPRLRLLAFCPEPEALPALRQWARCFGDGTLRTFP